ncbi:MAG: helix-turn-helix domain-containing protein [Desulfosporosinus sp.]|nr:helix-turn-helix domain-containing protein [Desulfosporosinus sp.]
MSDDSEVIDLLRQVEFKGGPMNRSIECYLSIKELSKYLQINHAKARGLAKDPSFPKIIFGERKVFPKDQVLAWMDKRSLRVKESLSGKVEETSEMQYNTESARV